MRYKIVIDGNKFYEIDEECMKKGMKCKEIQEEVPKNQNKNKTDYKKGENS